MKTRFLLSLLLSLTFFMFGSWSQTLGAAENDDLSKSKAYFHEPQAAPFEDAVARILSLSEISMSVSVNKVSDADLRFFVVDIIKMMNEGVDGIGGLSAEQLRNNFLVDRDGDIFVDRDFMSLILVNAFFDTFGFVQSFEMGQEALMQGYPIDFVQNMVIVMGGINNLNRLATIRNLNSPPDNEWHPRNVADYVSQATQSFEMQDILVMALAPIILHEIGHIQSGTQGYFLDGIIRSYLSSQVRQIEDAADNYAVEKLDRLLRNYSQSVEVFELVTMTQATLGTLKLLRDQVYFDAFEGLRGLGAEAYRSRVYYNNCVDHPETAALPINSFERIDHILDLQFPKLTASEFASVKEGFLKSSSSGTHSHHFSRAFDYAAVVGAHSPVSVEGMFAPSDPAYLAFLDDDPTKLPVLEVEGGLGVSKDEFLENLTGAFQFEEAVNCESGCWVGKALDGGTASIEIVGPEENISEVILNARVSAIDTGTSGDEAKDHVMTLGAMQRFFLNAHGNTQEMVGNEALDAFLQSPIFQAVVWSRAIALQCGAITTVADFGGLTHEIRTLDANGWLQVRVFETID